MEIKVVKKVLDANNEIAEQNRKIFLKIKFLL